MASSKESVELANELLVHGIGVDEMSAYVTRATGALMEHDETAGRLLRAVFLIAGGMSDEGHGDLFDGLMRVYGAMMLDGIDPDDETALAVQRGLADRCRALLAA